MDQYRVWPPTGSVLLDGGKWVRAVAYLPEANEWFTLEIIADGPSIMTKVNGQVVVPVSTWARTALKPGYILLQQYGPETRVEFRRIEIKELPRVPSGTPPPEAKTPPLAVAPFTDADVQRIAALPGALQIDEVRKELIRRNPHFDGKMEYSLQDGVVTEFRIGTDQVTDIAPIRVFNALRVLDFHPGRLADLTPLEGMNLAELKVLDLRDTKVSDAGMVYFKDCKKLTYLILADTGVTDKGLAHFKDCKDLTYLHLDHTQLGDAGLAYFKDCKALTHLFLSGTKVSDVGLAYFKDCKDLTYLHLDHTQLGDAGLAHFKGLPLMRLQIDDTGVTDLTPLQGMPLEDIRLTPKNITRGLDVLRDVKSLRTIGIDWNYAWLATEFWKRYDKGEFK